MVVYLHVEARPLRCKTVLRDRGGWKLVGLDLMGLHPQGRTLCHVRRHTTEEIKWCVHFISKACAVFSSLEQASTYSLALWRHVVCSWPAPLPPSASALSLAEVRKTVLKPDQLRCLGWIFSLFLPAQKWSRNSSLFCTIYTPETPERTWRAGVRWKKTTTQMLWFPSRSKCALIKFVSSWPRELTIEEDCWLPSIIIIIHVLTHWSVWHIDIL